ncbi:hypothetical protein HPB51_020823 [Rhipicephalus microplus]|uniref:RING-type E3 ubiquitin transferase n=1 Tax=Rhipicephalus microplus TaxID=6941 RepID=A0A9J6DQ59_RHIMP|nr:hypothetical protein HPB51_020823 [Rhipicephalus microplus]
MKDILKKSCEDLVGGLYQVALQGFKKVLSQKPNLTELDVVLVEYAAGCALLGMGSLEDLKNSVEYFLGIVSNHKDIVFPLAYYGVSRALIKMNRFSEALPHIEKCLSILQKGIQFSEALLWPETKTKVDNAKRPQLQKAMEEMQVLCRAPPKWDAMCCYEACPLQKSIYYSDPDFKGFQQVHCASKCLVQYHPACWREYRESRNLTEKFVHNQLLVETAPKQKKTNECIYVVTNARIVSFRSFTVISGRKRSWNNENRRNSSAVPLTLAPSSQRTIKMKMLLCCRSVPSCESTGAAVEDMPKEPSVERAKPPKVQPKPSSEQAAPATSEQAEAAHPVQRDAQYVLKKDEDIDEDIQVDGRAKKWKRKKNKPIRVLELEPSDNLYSEYQERIRRLAEYKNLVEEHGYWKDFCHKQKDMLFEDLIESKGPLSIHDKLLASEVMNFLSLPSGRLREGVACRAFLLRSLRFTFDGDMVYTMRMRPRRPCSHKSDEISLPDDGSDYEVRA